MAALAATRAAIVSRTLRWGFAVCFLVLLAVGAVVQFGALRRLRKLRDLARSLPDAMGVQARFAGRDEIGELARSFESVSFSLQRSLAEVDFQRQFLIDLIDRMDDAVAVFDDELRVVAANKSYLTRIVSDGSNNGIEQLSCADAPSCLHEAGSADCPTRRAFRTNRLEKGIHKKSADGEAVSYEVFASPMSDHSGAVSHVVEVWRDVTERVTLEASLAHSEQLATLGVLASGFSHEIATPLGTVATSIQGILRRLDGRDRLDEEDLSFVRRRLDLAVGEVFRCRDVTRSLLDLARERRTVAQEVDLTALAGRMIEVVRPTAEQKQVYVEYDASPKEISVVGHADQLEQIALNLFVNAIEAMPDGGVLSVTLSANDGHVDWTVSDTGCGLSERDKDRIFDPFFSKKAGGTGLGLYITKQLVHDHGGTIDILDSSARGTRLRIRLPLEPTSVPETETGHHERGPNSDGGIH